MHTYVYISDLVSNKTQSLEDNFSEYYTYYHIFYFDYLRFLNIFLFKLFCYFLVKNTQIIMYFDSFKFFEFDFLLRFLL